MKIDTPSIQDLNIDEKDETNKDILTSSSEDEQEEEQVAEIVTIETVQEYKLTLDQEAYFKQQLLKYAIQEEVVVYFNNPNMLEETLFLKFLFKNLTTIPLLTSKPQAKIRFQQLINTLPKIIIQSQVATKQETNDHFRKFAVKCFDVALRTPLEKQKDKTLKIFTDLDREEKDRQKKIRPKTLKDQATLEDLQDQQEEEERKKNPADMQREDTILRLQKRLTEVTQIIIMNVESKNHAGDNNGINYLFETILKTPNVHDLPPDLYEFATIIIKILSLWMEREMRDPKQVQKMKRLYMITPIKAIKASLAIANPVTLLKGIIIMFLAKPFGSRNLIQTICSVMVEGGKTDKISKKAYKDAEAQLSNLKSHVKKQVLNKVKGFVANMHQISDSNGQPITVFKEMPSVITILQYQWPSSPPLDSSVISQLEEEQFKSLFEYAKLEKRKKEKNDFVEILGNDEMIDIIRELLPVLYEPLGKLFCKANIGHHFEKLAHVIKKTIIAAETGELVEDEEDIDLSDYVDINESEPSTPRDAVSPNLNNSTPSSINNSNNNLQPTQSAPSSIASTPQKKGLFSKSMDWFSKPSIFSKSNNNGNQGNNNNNIAIDSPPQSPTGTVFVLDESQSAPTSPAPITNSTSTSSGFLQRFTNDLNDFLATSEEQQRQKQQSIKKKFKKDKSQTITLSERLVLFQDVNTTLIERVYKMVHELVVSDAKSNAELVNNNNKDNKDNSNNSSVESPPLSPTTNSSSSSDESFSSPVNSVKDNKNNNKDKEEEELKTGLLSQSVCWLLGLLQFLKDEEVDVFSEIYKPLSPNLKLNIIKELNAVIKYRDWRLQHGNKEATKENIEKVDKLHMSLEEEENKKPEKPSLEYLPTLTGPFISLIHQRFARLGDPAKYSLTNLSSIIGAANSPITSPLNIPNSFEGHTTTTTTTTTTNNNNNNSDSYNL
ncbi:hypothetical protein CYY_005487 [Polysphondylium violaceum]|uniref:PX domain-containing protein n=1 Tax=Polysphondylium violaceum TaxID=133409 RepID=A0A8J4PU59_9MYCE|nr:hypothetical protein CYY_005487 [Polysphondylium violaceum]